MAYTSNKKPGGLDAAVSLAGTNNIVVDQAGTVVRATLSQVEAKVFDAKTQVTPNNGDVVVVRRGNDIRQVVVENMLPAGSVTNAMLGGSIADSKLNTIDTAGKVTNQAVGATAGFSGSVYSNAIGANKIVTRDGSGNFAAGTITATLSGNATTATTATTANQVANTLTRGQYLTGSDYNGSVARSWAVDGAVAATANKVAVRDGSGALTATSFLGNATSATTAATATTVIDGAITDAKVTTDANQRIAGSKITPNFGIQALTAGNISGTALTTSGSISSNNATITGQTECRRAIGSGGWAVLAKNTAGSNDSGIFIDVGGNPSFEGRNGLGVLNTSIKSSGDSYIRGGNFGVGTNSPTQRIHVVGGDIRIDRTVDNMASGIDGAVSFGGTTEYIYGNRTNQALALGTNGANRLLIYNGGTDVLGDLNGSGSASFGGNITGQNLTVSGNSTVTGTIRSGGLPHFGCRAWVNFNGQGAIGVNQPIRGSGNVASVLKIALGVYRINFTEAMPNANYCFTATTNASAGAIGIVTEEDTDAVPSGRSTTFLEIRTWNNGGGAADRFYINVAIFA